MHVQCSRNLVVEDSLMGLQQRVGAPDHTRRSAALANEQQQASPVLLAQLDSVRLRSHTILLIRGRAPAPHLSRLLRGAPLRTGHEVQTATWKGIQLR